MYRISEATTEDFEEILAFLRRSGIYENTYLLWMVSDAFKWPENCRRIVLCRNNTGIAGVESVLDYTKIPEPDAYTDRNHQLHVYVDAVDRGALEALLQELPSEKMGWFRINRPFILEYFRELPDSSVHDPSYYYTLSPDQFKPVEGEAVIELTPANDALFEGCERKKPDWEHSYKERRRFAILRDGRAASSVSGGPIPPDSQDIRAVAWTIGGLYTETKYRRQGLARRLVSHVTELTLREGFVPIYDTEHDNIASQNLAKSLGYWQFAEERSCYWKKPEGFRG